MRLRGEFAMILLVRLSERGDVAEARERLQSLGQEMALTVTVRELVSEEFTSTEEIGVGYILRVYGADRPGIVHAVTSLLAGQGFNITDLETRVIPGEGGPVYVMVMELTAPSEERGEAARAELESLAARLQVEEVAKQLARARVAGGKAVAKRGPGKTRRERDKAAADPAAYFNGDYERQVQQLGLANILISGQTGVGKSTLINSVFRARLAAEGVGKPVTKLVQRYQVEGVPVTIYDTPGIELGQSKKEVIREYKKTIKDSLDRPLDEHERQHCDHQ